MTSHKKSKSIRLQTRLILSSSLLILLLMLMTIILVEKRQSEAIRLEAQKRGITIARNLAGVSTNALITYNYVVLEQNAERVSEEEDVAYVIIHDKEHRMAAFTGHGEKQGQLLTDLVSQKALSAREPYIQSITYGERKVPALDLSVPVYVEGSEEKWGTIRIGLSLERMASEILRTRLNLLLLGLFALGFGILGSVFFSKRITRPLSKLVETTISAAQGNLEQVSDIRTRDEIEELGNNFNRMIRQIRLDREELESRLREITALKTYTDNVISSMTNGLITTDLGKKVVSANETVERILGRRKEEMIGRPLDKVLGDHHPLLKLITETLSKNRGIVIPEMELKKDAETLWLIACTSILTDGEGNRIGALAVFQDITEMKTLEEKLRQADRLAALGTLSAGLAHEIKNPLSAIKTFVQLLPQKIDNPSFLVKFKNTVPREIDRINQLVENLLELTRTRKHPMNALDVNQLITQVIDLHGEEMSKKHISFNDRLTRTIPLIKGDSETLYRAFSNLIINSIQAMTSGGTLFVSSGPEDSECSMVEIVIHDTGIGMDETTTKNLFNPFFTTKEKGVGLGMALTRKIIEDHQGTIEVQSEKGKGTTSTLRLPAVVA